MKNFAAKAAAAVTLLASAEVKAEKSKFGMPPWTFGPPPRKTHNTLALTTEVCQRSVNRLKYQSVDFNDVIRQNPDTRWTDESFGFPDAIYWNDLRPKYGQRSQKKANQGYWRSLSDVLDERYSLWGSTEIQPTDAVQGGFGDCWFIAAASSVAQDERRLKKIFLTEGLNKTGIYALQLYLMGIPVTVTVDDNFVFLQSEGAAFEYGQPGRDGAVWLPILEKAVSKLYGNYEMMQSGYPGLAVQMLTGAPYFATPHAEVSVDDLWNYIDGKLAKNWMVTTSTGGWYSSLGLQPNHAYTVLKTVQLSDGTKLIRVRNPLRYDCYYGDWGDDSPKWTEQFKQEAGYVDADDGMFFMNARDYHENFAGTEANPDVQGQKLAYKAFFDLDTSGEPFYEQITIQSPVDQKVYISAYTYNLQHYKDNECSENKYDSFGYITAGQGWWDFYFMAYHADGIDMTAGESLDMEYEIFWGAEDLAPHDFSIVVWSTVEPVTFTGGNDYSSQSFPVYQMQSDVTLYGLFGGVVQCSDCDGSSTVQDGDDDTIPDGDHDGIPDTDEIPVVDTCDGTTSEPFKQKFGGSLDHHFCINGRHQQNKVEVVDGWRTLIQETKLTLNNDQSYDFSVVYEFTPHEVTQIGNEDDLTVYISFKGIDFEWVRDGQENIGGRWENFGEYDGVDFWAEVSTMFGLEHEWPVPNAQARIQIWTNDAYSTYFASYVDFYEPKYAGTFWQGDMLARGDWAFTFTNIPGDDTDEHGSQLIDQDKVRDPNTKVVITNPDTDNFYIGEYDTVRDYELYVNDTYRVHDMLSVVSATSLMQQIKFTGPDRSLVWLTIHTTYTGQSLQVKLQWNGEWYDVQQFSWWGDTDTQTISCKSCSSAFYYDITYWVEAGFYVLQVYDEDLGRRWWQNISLKNGSVQQDFSVNSIPIWEDLWEFKSSSIWNPNSDESVHGLGRLMLKGADEANLGEQDPEEGSSNVAVIASSSIFGLTLCAYFVYKKCIDGKQIAEDYQRA